MPARHGASVCATVVSKNRSTAVRCPVTFPEMPGVTYLLPVMSYPVMTSTWCRPVTAVPDMAATFPEPGTAYPDIAGTWRDADDFSIRCGRCGFYDDHARRIGRLGIHGLNDGHGLYHGYGLCMIIRTRCHDTACHGGGSGQGCQYCQLMGDCFHFYNSSLIDTC